MTEDLQPVFEHEVLLGSVVCADAGASEALRSRVIDGLVRFVKNPEMHAEGLQMNALTQDSSEPEKMVFHRSLQAGKVSFEDRVTVTQDAVIFDVSRQQEEIWEICSEASKYDSRGYYSESRQILEEGMIEREGVFLLRFSYEGEPGQKYPEYVEVLRQKAWVAKDQALASAVAHDAGF